jgi:hypothetical protein
LSNIIKNLPREVGIYLEKYSLPGWQIEKSGYKNITCIVIIPAIAEFENIKTLIISLAENDPLYFSKTLILFVINNFASSDPDVISENQKTIHFLKKIQHKESDNEFLTKIISSGLQIDYIDASSKGKELPEKEGGVGLARKIGMDLALGIFDYAAYGKKILVCLDADCTVDKNYITEIHRTYNTKNLQAAYINFRHSLSENAEENMAIICYEIFILYYMLGLKFANSIYDFPTIGSLITCDYKSYFKIEGMNKRKAAEDFYFMEKLAKNFKIEKINSTTVYPSGRISWRVPFGTGQRVKRFLSGTQDEYRVYSTQSFVILKNWLEVFNEPDIKSTNEYLKKAKKIHQLLYGFLVGQNFEQSWDRIKKNYKSPETLQKQKITWFDGFRTMKLIHYLRDNGFSLQPMFHSADELLELMDFPSIGWNKPEIPTIEIQQKYLELLRNILL